MTSSCLQGAITKRMTAIEEMAGMDVLCSDKTGTLTLNKLSVDKNLIEVISSTWSLHLENICIKIDRTWAIDLLYRTCGFGL